MAAAVRGAVAVSVPLQWSVALHSSFLITRDRQTCSTKPGNMMALDSFPGNGAASSQDTGHGASGRWQRSAGWWCLSGSGNPASESRPPPTCGPPSTRTPGPLSSIPRLICCAGTCARHPHSQCPRCSRKPVAVKRQRTPHTPPARPKQCSISRLA